MVKIYTAQYNYKGGGRLDITVKGKHPIGRVFAPTWNMVMNLKQNPNYTEDNYKEDYSSLMLTSYGENRHLWDYVLSLNLEQSILVKDNGCRED